MEERGILAAFTSNGLLSTEQDVIEELDDFDTNPCNAPKDSGHACDSILEGVMQERRFYWNEKKFACVAFMYSGCGGNRNRFVEKYECEQRCRPGKSGCFKSRRCFRNSTTET